MANIQSICSQPSAGENALQTRDVLAYLLAHATPMQAKCFELLSAESEQAGLAQNATLKEGKIKHIEALAALVTCQIITQWGTEQDFGLFLPIVGPQAELLPKAIQIFQKQKTLAVLSLSKTPELLQKTQFVAAWEYVITVSFPADEKNLWVLPLKRTELERHGGEVKLPRELAGLWDCS